MNPRSKQNNSRNGRRRKMRGYQSRVFGVRKMRRRSGIVDENGNVVPIGREITQGGKDNGNPECRGSQLSKMDLKCKANKAAVKKCITAKAFGYRLYAPTPDKPTPPPRKPKKDKGNESKG